MSTTLEAKKQKILNFGGPIAAPVTPFDKNGVLDTSKITEYAQHLVSLGVKAVYISGTTGEGFSLSIDEKLQLLQAWRVALDSLPEHKKLLSIVHGSSTVVGDIVKYAQKVEELGFDCFALLPPLYYKVTTREQLVSYIKRIMDEAAPNTPFLYYHSYMTGELPFELTNFVELALEKIPQFVAVKFSHNNIVQFGSVQMQFGDRVKLCPGMNEILLATTVFGVDSPIISTFSLPDMVRWYRSMWDAFTRADLAQARRDQKSISDKTIVLRKNGYMAAIKAELNVLLEGKGLFFGKPRMPVYFDLSNIQ